MVIITGSSEFCFCGHQNVNVGLGPEAVPAAGFTPALEVNLGPLLEPAVLSAPL